MEDLKSILRNVYENVGIKNRSYYGMVTLDESSCYLNIPISNDTFEIPAFVLDAFSSKNIHMLSDVNSADTIAVRLEYHGLKAFYKSLNCNVRSVFETNKEGGIIQFPEMGDLGRVYYGVQGAIFYANHSPAMMLTWEMQRTPMENSSNVTENFYKLLRPILRVHPEVLINKSDSMERFIVNKIIPEALSLNYVHTPILHNCNVITNLCTSNTYKVKVIIDKFPFTITYIDKPSISTTNEELLQVALDNIDELIQ